MANVSPNGEPIATPSVYLLKISLNTKQEDLTAGVKSCLKWHFNNPFTFLLHWNARSAQMFIVLFKRMLVKSDWMSNEVINSEESWSLISLQKENESLTLYSLTVNSLRICTKNFGRLYFAVPIPDKIGQKVGCRLWMNNIYELYANHAWYQAYYQLVLQIFNPLCKDNFCSIGHLSSFW